MPRWRRLVRRLNVLLIQLKRIGDLILTVPAIAALREKFPSAKITLVVAHGSRELLPAIQGVDHAVVMRGGVSDLPRWLAIARTGFDYCFDFSRTDRSAFLSLLSCAQHRVTYTSAPHELLREFCYNEVVPSRVQTLHTIDHHLALLDSLGINEPRPEIGLALPDAAQKRAAEIIETRNLGEDFVVLHVGSARAEKFWLAERWAEVIDRLRDQFTFVLTSGSSPLELEQIAKIKSQLRAPVVDLAGELDLLTLAALIARARLLVTIDSAPMHLAGALGTPQVALFGPTNPFHWRPRTTPALILQGEKASSGEDFAPKQPPAAMNEISTEQVIDAMQSLLSTPAARES
ncbi:MAG TPA: glycosyltransferase family 9 protein [Chthoniobacterales bacterium]